MPGLRLTLRLMAIFHLAHELKELEQRAIMVYEPIVNAIVTSRSLTFAK